MAASLHNSSHSAQDPDRHCSNDQLLRRKDGELSMGLFGLGKRLWIRRRSEYKADIHRLHPRWNIEGKGVENSSVGLARLDKPEAVGTWFCQPNLNRWLQDSALGGLDFNVQVHQVVQKEDFLAG